MFYREFTFDKNDFRASDGNKVELADNVIWLDDCVVRIIVTHRAPSFVNIGQQLYMISLLAYVFMSMQLRPYVAAQ